MSGCDEGNHIFNETRISNEGLQEGCGKNMLDVYHVHQEQIVFPSGTDRYPRDDPEPLSVARRVKLLAHITLFS